MTPSAVLKILYQLTKKKRKKKNRKCIKDSCVRKRCKHFMLYIYVHLIDNRSFAVEDLVKVRIFLLPLLMKQYC